MKSMIDISYKYFEFYSKHKNPKKYGVAQNLSFRELRKLSQKFFQRQFCKVCCSQNIKKYMLNER